MVVADVSALSCTATEGMTGVLVVLACAVRAWSGEAVRSATCMQTKHIMQPYAVGRVHFGMQQCRRLVDSSAHHVTQHGACAPLAPAGWHPAVAWPAGPCAPVMPSACAAHGTASQERDRGQQLLQDRLCCCQLHRQHACSACCATDFSPRGGTGAPQAASTRVQFRAPACARQLPSCVGAAGSLCLLPRSSCCSLR